ncbi:bile acid:sodium symporter family protein [Nocardia tengchongensis]
MRFLSKFYIDGFILSILGMVVLASILPARGDAAEVVSWLTKIAIAILFLLYGTRLAPQEALAGLKHWRLHLTVLACTFILFPVIGLAARVLVPHILTQDLYTGLLFLCLVPSTVQSSIAFTSIAKGNVAGAIVSATVSNLLGVFLTPALVILLMNTTGQASVDPSAVVDIVLQLLVPFFVGQLIRPKVKGFLSRYAEPTKLVDRGSILLVVYSAFSAGMVEGIWHAMSPWRILGLALVCCAILAIVLVATGFLGEALGFDRADRIVVVFCGSKKSLATGLPMATVLFAGHSVGLIVLPLMMFHQIQLITCAALAGRWARTAPSATAADCPPGAEDA